MIWRMTTCMVTGRYSKKMVHKTVYRGVSEKAAGFIYKGPEKGFGAMRWYYGYGFYGSFEFGQNI